MEGLGNPENRAAPSEDHQAAVINAKLHDGDVCDARREEELEIELDTGSNTVFIVDYCKKGETKCRRCRKNILKGELRIGKSAWFKAKSIYHYFHVKCAFESFEKARSVANTISCMDDISGFELIKDEDRIFILKLMDEMIAKRTQLAVESQPKKVHTQKKRFFHHQRSELQN